MSGNSSRVPVIRAYSAWTPLGCGREIAFATARTGAQGFRLTDNFPRRLGGQPILHARVSLVEAPGPRDRIVELAIGALGDLGESFASGAPPAVLLGLPYRRPGLTEMDIEAIAGSILGAVPGGIRTELSGLYSGGSETGFFALARAVDLIRSGEVDRCLLGAADSMLELSYLHWLESLGRLPSSKNPAGLIPGEGACWLLVERAAPHNEGHPVSVMGVGLGIEPSPWYDGNEPTGSGFTASIASTFPPGTVADSVYSDFNGEDWRVQEWTLAYLRSSRHVADPLDLHHAADGWGDLGAAAGLASAACAAFELERWGRPSQKILVIGASDIGPHRGACLLATGRDGTKLRWLRPFS